MSVISDVFGWICLCELLGVAMMKRNGEETFFLFINGEKQGPLTREEVLSADLSAGGMIKEGNGPWQDIAGVEWLNFADSENTQSSDRDNSPADDGTAFAPADNGTIVECPHCWTSFSLKEVNYIAKHIDLIGDPILGPEAQLRFLPTAFNSQGYALDAKGMVCQEMACPTCHLRIPEPCIQLPNHAYSIVGAPASGKSYYLTSMVWQLRKTLSADFDWNMNDTDEVFNSVVNEYEQLLFLNLNSDVNVSLPKTELQGNNYSNQVILNGMNVDLPLPFIFTLTPMGTNQRADNCGMKNFVLYDNAGEHFEPGRDQVTNLATQHLIHADSITFLYDPLKDSRFSASCNQADPQLRQQGNGRNQLILLNEMITRIRKYLGMGIKEKYNKPLIVVIPKYDTWESIFPFPLRELEFIYYNSEKMCSYLNVGVVMAVSFMMREVLTKVAPDLVATSENFFESVYFIPMSALGSIPERDAHNVIGIKPSKISPVWAEVPMLLQFWLSGMIPAVNAVDVDATPITNYKFTDHAMLYNLPGLNVRETVPLNYCGYKVYSLKLNSYIQLPDLPEAAAAKQEAKQEDKKEDDNAFWDNLEI